MKDADLRGLTQIGLIVKLLSAFIRVNLRFQIDTLI